ncbi:MAG: hypothetical protein HY928_16220 [Elusimicrobia bacterium]|nr:hypothetical protein [Elusimicrobiota bacterium]
MNKADESLALMLDGYELEALIKLLEFAGKHSKEFIVAIENDAECGGLVRLTDKAGMMRRGETVH